MVAICNSFWPGKKASVFVVGGDDDGVVVGGGGGVVGVVVVQCRCCCGERPGPAGGGVELFLTGPAKKRASLW